MRRLILAAACLTLAACEPREPAPAPGPAKVDPKEIVREPTWVKRPTVAQIEALRPKAAKGLKLSGLANLWCVAKADGTLTDCQLDWQDPPGLGLGDAAMELMPLYQIGPADRLGLVEGRQVQVRVAWKGPRQAPPSEP